MTRWKSSSDLARHYGRLLTECVFGVDHFSEKDSANDNTEGSKDCQWFTGFY